MTKDLDPLPIEPIDKPLAEDDFQLPPLPSSGKVALLGGSFHPPHVGHALLALNILSVVDVDAVWVLPCADHPFGKELAPFEHRKIMCELSFAHLPEVSVLDVESHMPTPSFTVQTIRALKKRLPNLLPSFVVGTDILDELHLWREPDALQEMCDLIVVPRGGHVTGEGRGKSSLELILPEVSSSEVRRRLKAGEDTSSLVDKKVLRYMRAHGLY
ncbi:MAG: nicotinate (nicotinamide) nucleotide adenylyltransferase [Deltaproteobacteria bacterium]|nr:nicotinate (nicotinamide) nucleotide adenylyltransferase [Deltaproteobacteria bacterium]